MGNFLWLPQLLHHILLFLLVFGVVSSSSHNPNPLCLSDDKLALLQFKSAMSIDDYSHCGDSYPKTKSWNESSNCCSWEGVSCDYATGQVIALDLSCSVLTGSFPQNTSLFRLQGLKQLNLAFNNFKGSLIPHGISQLVSLEYLNLSSSSIAGLVLSDVSFLTKLTSLDLSQNFRDVSFDSHTFEMLTFNLSKLENLFLDGLYMSDVVPTYFKNLSLPLKRLSVHDCNLEGEFPSEIFQLGKLEYLDLSQNSLTGHLPKSNWSSLLRLLDLYGNDFRGSVPASLGNLTKITSLDFSYNLFEGQISDVFGNLNELTTLDFSGCSFSGQLPPSLFNLTQLTHLDFSSNGLDGPLPTNVTGLQNLKEFNSGSNLLTGGVPSWLFTLPSLEYLDLTNNSLTGPIHEIHKPNSVQEVHLGNNDIHGEIPTSFFDLVKLIHLDLSSNNLSWVINSDMLSKLENLETLDLASNNLSGVAKLDVLSKLKNLLALDLSNNKLLSVSGDSGVISTFQALQSLDLASCYVRQFPNILLSVKSLTYLNLSSNNLSWVIKSDMLSKLESLDTLDLSSNNLSGVAKLDVLSKLQNLSILDLSNNKLLSVSSDSGVISTFQALWSLKLSSCNVRQFPNFLRSIKSLIYLDLSNNAIRGSILNWESDGWERLATLNLAHNFLTSIEEFPGKNLHTLDLRSNHLRGEMPPSICNLTSLYSLDLSSNYLGGVIPTCLGNFSYQVSIINLQSNNFRGKIPDFCVDYGNSLTTLALNDNQLEGLLPRSLVNCTYLRFLNVASNNLNGHFPRQLGGHLYLQILILRSNGFYGRLDKSMDDSDFSRLQVADLSQNDFTGPLPTKFFKRLRAVKIARCSIYDLILVSECQRYGVVQYGNFINVTMKRLEREFDMVKSLAGFALVDFSDNRFNGPIPKVLGELHSLIGLNLSHNHLTGPLPSSIGNMAALESLDLSSNKLGGRIPSEWIKLTFLEVLNLSHNNLVGPIPVGNQFNTFDNDSYAGNLDLCGFPLSKKCGNEEEPKPPTSKLVKVDGSAVPFIWQLVMMGYGCGVVLGLSTGYIVFTTGRPWWFVRMVERDWQRNFTRWVCRIQKKRNLH